MMEFRQNRVSARTCVTVGVRAHQGSSRHSMLREPTVWEQLRAACPFMPQSWHIHVEESLLSARGLG